MKFIKLNPLNQFLFVLMAVSIMSSCSTVHLPEETYLVDSNMIDIKHVAVMTSINSPEVMLSRTEQSLVGEVSGIVIYHLERAVRRDIDKKHSEAIDQKVDISFYENAIAQSFIQQLISHDRFETTEYIKEKEQTDNVQLNRYDAVIKIDVDKIYLDKDTGNNLKLSLHLTTEMKNLKTGEILLNRKEFVPSSGSYTLDHYKENIEKELDRLLDKAGKKIAYDFIYLARSNG